MQSAPQVSHAYETVLAPCWKDDWEVRAEASTAEMGREDLTEVWYMDFLSSREAGVPVFVWVEDEFMPVCVPGRWVPGCSGWRPFGVSRVTRK